MPGSDPAAVLTQNLMAVMGAHRVLAAGHRSNDACLRARRHLEHALSLHGVQAEEYLDAARSMEDAGLPLHADTLRQIAATEPELAHARLMWDQRRNARPHSHAERAAGRWISQGLVLAAEPYLQGVDGCFHGLSRLRGDLLAPREFGITIMTSARRPHLVAGFADLASTREWLLDRTRHAPVPLSACRTGPECRVTREERLLAGLLQRPASAITDLGVTAEMWTSDLRAEIFLSWRATAPARSRGPSRQAVARDLERRMLRAPEDCLRITGPAGGLPMAYLARLTATPVRADRYLAAAHDLHKEDQAMARFAHDADAALEELAALRARPAAQQPLRAPPGPAPGPGRPMPRH